MGHYRLEWLRYDVAAGDAQLYTSLAMSLAVLTGAVADYESRG